MLEVMLARPAFGLRLSTGILLVLLPSVPGVVEEKCKSNKKLKNAHLAGLTGMPMLHGAALRSSQPYCQNCRLRSRSRGSFGCVFWADAGVSACWVAPCWWAVSLRSE